MNSISVLVDNKAIKVEVNKLHEEIYSADRVAADCSRKEFSEARRYLCKAEERFDVLYGLKLLPEWQTIAENLSRIRKNHEYIATRIYPQKRRKS